MQVSTCLENPPDAAYTGTRPIQPNIQSLTLISEESLTLISEEFVQEKRESELEYLHKLSTMEGSEGTLVKYPHLLILGP